MAAPRFLKVYHTWGKMVLAALPHMPDPTISLLFLVMERIGSDAGLYNSAHLVRLDHVADAALLGVHRTSLASAKSWLVAHGLLDIPTKRLGQICITREQTDRLAACPHAETVLRSPWVRIPIRQAFIGDPVTYARDQARSTDQEQPVLPYAKPAAGMMRDPHTGRIRRVLLNMPAPAMDRRPFVQFGRNLLLLLPRIRASHPATRRAALYILATVATGVLGFDGPNLLVLEPRTAAAACRRSLLTWQRGLAGLLALGLVRQITGHAYRIDAGLIHAGHRTDMGNASRHLHAAARRQARSVRRKANPVTPAAAANPRTTSASCA